MCSYNWSYVLVKLLFFRSEQTFILEVNGIVVGGICVAFGDADAWEGTWAGRQPNTATTW